MIHKSKMIVATVALIVGLSGCVGVSPDGKGYTMSVPLSSVNNTVAQNFPQEQKIKYGTLLIEKPNLLGKQGSDKLSVGTGFVYKNALIPNGIRGAISLSGGVRYNPSDRGLYLSSPMIDELTFQNFSLSNYITPEMRTLIGDVIAQQLMKKPIYHLNSPAATFVKGVSVKDGNLLVNIGL